MATFLGVPSNRNSDPFASALLNDNSKPVRQHQGIKKPPSIVEYRKPSPKEEEDDDAKSYYSERSFQTFSYPTSIYPPLPEEVKERRRQEYHDAMYPNKTMKEVKTEEDERVNINNLDIEGRYQRTEFSRSFMAVKTSAHVPDYCTNLHEGSFFGEVSLTKTTSNQYRPKNTSACFGSIWDWGQGGEEIPPRATPGGDLSNVYLIQLSFTQFFSTCPFSVGVLVGEVKKGGKFHPLRRRRVYSDSNYYAASREDIANWDGESFHYIIYPSEKSTGESRHLYQSGPHLNNAYGRAYSFLTSDEKKILSRCEPLGENGRNGWTVPIRHPVLNWCFNESDLPDEELPKRSLDHSSETEYYYNVKQKVMKMAVEALKQKAELYIPVTDMRLLSIKFIPLSNAPVSQDQTLREEIKRRFLMDSKFQASYEEVLTTHHSTKKQYDKQLKESYGISFNVQYFTMFRGFVQDAVEKEDVIHEEGEEEGS